MLAFVPPNRAFDQIPRLTGFFVFCYETHTDEMVHTTHGQNRVLSTACNLKYYNCSSRS